MQCSHVHSIRIQFLSDTEHALSLYRLKFHSGNTVLFLRNQLVFILREGGKSVKSQIYESFFKLNIQIKLFSRQTLHNKRTHSNSIRLNYRRGQQAQICACQQSTCCFLKEAKVNWSNRGETVPKLVLYGFTGMPWGFRTNFILDGTKNQYSRLLKSWEDWNVLSNVLSNPNNLMNRRSATPALCFALKNTEPGLQKGVAIGITGAYLLW